MIKITIEGDSGSGKTIISNNIINSIKRNKILKKINGDKPFLGILREGGKFHKNDNGIYDVVIITKISK